MIQMKNFVHGKRIATTALIALCLMSAGATSKHNEKTDSSSVEPKNTISVRKDAEEAVIEDEAVALSAVEIVTEEAALPETIKDEETPLALFSTNRVTSSRVQAVTSTVSTAPVEEIEVPVPDYETIDDGSLHVYVPATTVTATELEQAPVTTIELSDEVLTSIYTDSETLAAIEALRELEQLQEAAAAAQESVTAAQNTYDSAYDHYLAVTSERDSIQAELEAAKAEAAAIAEQLASAQTTQEGTAATLTEAQKAAAAAAEKVEAAQAELAAKEAAAEEAAKALNSVTKQYQEAQKAAEEAAIKAAELAQSSKIYDAIKVIEQGVEDGVVQRDWDGDGSTENYFGDKMSVGESFNSTGKNFAGQMNEYLENTGVLDTTTQGEDGSVVVTTDDYTYRIYKCKGGAEEGFNIFFTLNSVDKTGDSVENVVRYNTVTQQYYIGSTVVTTDNRNNLVLSGGTYKGVDITSEAIAAIQATIDAKAELEAANQTVVNLGTAVTDAQDAVDEANLAVDTAQSELTAAEDKQDAANVVVESAQAADDAAKETVEVLEGEKAEQDQVVTDLTEDLSAAEEVVSEAADAVDAAQAGLSQAQDALTEANAAVDAVVNAE